MKKAVIFGAGQAAGKVIYPLVKDNYDILCFIDNNSALWNTTIFNKPVNSINILSSIEYDFVIIASQLGRHDMKSQLLNLNIDESKIITSYVEFPLKVRNMFLKNFCSMVYENGIPGNVAEAGVFQGEFAAEINKNFYDRKIYLFDTFEGFNKKDISIEISNGFSTPKEGHFNNTSEKLVLEKMTYRENCIIKKGYFPWSAFNINDQFCFVNLDMDLYKPTLEGLNYFSLYMVRGGGILIHDYFDKTYCGVKYAVKDFLSAKSNRNLNFLPIGDDSSIVIIGF